MALCNHTFVTISYNTPYTMQDVLRENLVHGTEHLKFLVNNYNNPDILVPETGSGGFHMRLPQILYYDIINEPDDWDREYFIKEYHNACASYHDSYANLIIGKDLHLIIDNITNVLNKIFDGYNVKLITVNIEINQYRSYYPTLIELILFNKFNIIDIQRNSRNVLYNTNGNIFVIEKKQKVINIDN